MDIIKFKNGICFNTDCMKLMKEMKNNSVDLTLTDIPYNGVKRKSNGLRNLDKGKADVLTFDLHSFWKFNIQSNVKEYLHQYLHQNCKIDDVENILYKCGNDWDNWENFVNNLMLYLKKIKEKLKNDKIVIDK